MRMVIFILSERNKKWKDRRIRRRVPCFGKMKTKEEKASAKTEQERDRGVANGFHLYSCFEISWRYLQIVFFFCIKNRFCFLLKDFSTTFFLVRIFKKYFNHV